MTLENLSRLSRADLAQRLLQCPRHSGEWSRLRGECLRRASRWGRVAGLCLKAGLVCILLVQLLVMLRATG